MRALPDNNLSYPVLIEVGGGSGSGFYFRTEKKIFLVTAQHVLYKMDKSKKILRSDKLRATSYDEDLSNTAPIEILIDLTKSSIRKDESKDIVLIEIANITLDNNHKIDYLNSIIQAPRSRYTVVVVPPKLLKKFDDVLISNEVFILGYPSSLGDPNRPQIEAKRPLLRKGIIAGKNMVNKTIILDCPVYFGNSGGLAIEAENVGDRTKYSVIGVVSEFIPFIERLESVQLRYTNLNFENSGYSVVVPIDSILDLTTEPIQKL